MMKHLFPVVPLVVGLAFGTTTMAAVAGEKNCERLSAAQLDSRFADFNEAWASKNPDTVTALFDDDAVLLATLANVPRTDHASIRDYFVGFLKNSPVGQIDSSTIKSGCNWALRVGAWTVNLTDGTSGAKSSVKARYSFLYGFEDGQWKIEHLHSSVMPEKSDS